MAERFVNRGHPYYSVFVHITHSTNVTGVFRSIIAHPEASLLANTYGIFNIHRDNGVTAYLQSTPAYVGFVLEADAKPGHVLTIELQEYLDFLEFLLQKWPQVKQRFLGLESDANQEGEWQIMSNLYVFGQCEATYDRNISQDLIFNAWSEITLDKTTHQPVMKYHCRLKKHDQVIWIDFPTMSNIITDTNVLSYLKNVYKVDGN